MGFDDRPDYDHYNAISDAIAADPGVFKDQAERDAFLAVMNHAVENAKDAQEKLAIVQKVGDVIKGGLQGGLSGAIAAILGALAPKA